jgi:hypothetical protein
MQAGIVYTLGVEGTVLVAARTMRGGLNIYFPETRRRVRRQPSPQVTFLSSFRTTDERPGKMNRSEAACI